MTTLVAHSVRSRGLVALAQFVRNSAQYERDLPNQGGSTVPARNHLQALDQFGAYLDTLVRGNSLPEGGLDETLVLADAVFASIGKDRGDYKPARDVQPVLSAMGKGGAIDTKSLLIELLSAEIRAHARDTKQREAQAQTALSEREAAVIELADVKARLASEAAAREAAQAGEVRWRIESEKLRAQVVHLQTFGPEPTSAVGAELPALVTDDMPTGADLEAALDTRRYRADHWPAGIHLSRRGEGARRETWYEVRHSGHWDWLVPVSSGMTLTQAAEARQRLIDGSKDVK